jgi:hypothetical protein
MDNNVPVGMSLNLYWLHEAAALCCPITWENVHMFGKEAIRTMIRVTIPLNFSTAEFALKVFNVLCKGYTHADWPRLRPFPSSK